MKTKQNKNEKYRELLQDKHYYLDQILPEGWDDSDDSFIAGREKCWLKERKIYGFDERETWEMERNFYIWLYEHIMRYKEICCVDLTYHKFKYKRREYTQEELMNEILERIEFYFTYIYRHQEKFKISKKLAQNKYYIQYGYYDDWNDKQNSIVQEIAKIWAIILPAMWW